MENLNDLVEELRNNKNIRYYDEAATKQGIVLRILNLLGWNTFSIDEVYPEYPVSTLKIDYALRIAGENKIFIEVKRIDTDLEKHQEQLLKYSFQEGIRLSILTNGISWWFYLPLNEGNWENRKFYTIDLFQQQISDLSEKFQLLLDKKSVKTGDAFQSAKEIFQEQRHRQNTRKNLPKAWNKLISEPDELIIDLLGETVEKISGYKAEPKLIRDFLFKQKNKFLVELEAIEEPKHKNFDRHFEEKKNADWRVSTNDKKRSKLSGNIFPLKVLKTKDVTHKKPKILIIENREIDIRSWSQLCREFVRYLYDTEKLTKEDLPIFNAAGKDKYFINRQSEHSLPGKDAQWSAVGDIFVDVKYAASVHIDNLISTLEQLHIKNLDVKIGF